MEKINYQKKTRNFSIIAHIDHGKSTLADRFLENSKNIRKDKLKTQILDSLDIEKERGITIKLNTVRLLYHDLNQQEYIFNLIDTPGHADFNYEVSRSLASCDGALLLVDITQGIQSQTIINFNLAKKNDLFIIPVINKIDLQRDGLEELKIKLEKLTGFSKNLIPMISSKTGENISSLIEKIINYLPYPKGEKELPLQALIFDSFYDRYKGVIIFFCVKNGTLKVGNKIKTMSNNQEFIVNELGIKTLEFEKKDYLQVGDIG
jgi:GTP-binding protein LepA